MINLNNLVTVIFTFSLDITNIHRIGKSGALVGLTWKEHVMHHAKLQLLYILNFVFTFADFILFHVYICIYNLKQY